eukprot:CAMPEP_0172492492 /NCGR_PEP_ID=MMETSP1066-20121228/23677_1 /TAXON_ID=671091 /ORGANISM="Coscinodiscus wailesii, Strain CCMP2513" /LENGTH=352 /DNA_ID=CAMNT_0013262159 /DNA_START=74 /DNA_END=1132 /DNA_ORIENTATION=+
MTLSDLEESMSNFERSVIELEESLSNLEAHTDSKVSNENLDTLNTNIEFVSSDSQPMKMALIDLMDSIDMEESLTNFKTYQKKVVFDTNEEVIAIDNEAQMSHRMKMALMNLMDSMSSFPSFDDCPNVVVSKTKKTVRFCTDHQVITVNSRQQITRTQRKAIWYRRKDISVIKSDNNSIINSLNINDCIELSENGKHSIRGLEHLIDMEYAERRNRIKRAYFKLVLGEQSRQRMLGYSSDERLRNASESISRWHQECALASGNIDSFFVQAISENDSMCDNKYYSALKLKCFDVYSGKGLMKYIWSHNNPKHGGDIENGSVSRLGTNNEDNKRLTLGELLWCAGCSMAVRVR